MNRSLMAFLFCLSSTIVNAQEQGKTFQVTKTMNCSDVATVFGQLADNYGETMKWVGKDLETNTYITILKNSDSGSWTLIQNDSRVACVLASGQQGSPI